MLDLGLLKKIFAENEKIEALQTNEAEFIPFLVCLQALNTDDSMSFRAITLLYEMLQNDDLRNKIEEKYNYTIADLQSSTETTSNSQRPRRSTIAIRVIVSG